MIRVRIAEKRYGDATILRDVNFDIALGHTVALLGPSGVGKSTVLRILAGIDADFVGAVERPEAISIVFQEPTLLPWRSAFDNLALTHPSLPAERLQAMLERVGLAGKERHFPGQLSLGQQRRLALARAFVGAPALLVLDEPFVSLDAETSEAMISLAEALIAETKPATLLVTHARAEADRLADAVLELNGEPATLQRADARSSRSGD